MADRRHLSSYDADRPGRDAARRTRLNDDIRTVIGTLTDITEALELVSITNPPPDPDRRCIVCGAMDCACPQPGVSSGSRSNRPSDPTHTGWVRIEQGVLRARRRYLEVIRAVEELASQFNLDFDDELEPVAAAIDPDCPHCGPNDHPDDCTHDLPRAAWLRPNDPKRPGTSSLTVAFRNAETAIHGCLDEVQNVWMFALDDGESETTLAWTAQSIRKLRGAARHVLDALVAPAHPNAGKRPDPCRCDGANCDGVHWPGECENLPDRRTKCSSCRSRDFRADRASQEGAA